MPLGPFAPHREGNQAGGEEESGRRFGNTITLPFGGLSLYLTALLLVLGLAGLQLISILAVVRVDQS